METFWQEALFAAVEAGEAGQVQGIFLDATGEGQLRLRLSSLNTQGLTALHVAARHGHASTVQVLLDAGAGVNGTDACGRTPLHAAAGARNISVVELLLAHGAECDAVEAGGWTVLHRAACCGCCNAVSLLLAAGADPGKGRQGSDSVVALAVDHAVRTEDARTVDELLSHVARCGMTVSVSAHDLVTAAMVVERKSRCSFVDVQRELVVKLLAAAGWRDRNEARAALQQQLRDVQPSCAVCLVAGALLQGWLQADAATDAAVAAFDDVSRPCMQHMLVTAAAAVREW